MIAQLAVYLSVVYGVDGWVLIFSVMRFLKNGCVYYGFGGNKVYAGIFIINSPFNHFIFNLPS